MVWAVRDGRLSPEAVQKGRELRTEYVIESGLTDGTVVVTDANNAVLKSGLRVSASD